MRRLALACGLLAILALAPLAHAQAAGAGAAANASANVTRDAAPLHERARAGGLAPQVAIIAFVAAGAFVPLNLWRRWWLPKLLAAGQRELSRAGAWIKRSGVWWHMGLGVVTLVAGTWHGLTARASNWELWAGMIGLGLLLVLGTIIHWRWIPWLARQRAAMYWTKWGVTVLSISLIAYGHGIAHPPRPPRVG